MEKIIELKNLTKNFDDQQVLKGINLDIHHNEFLTLLGPSGCGKTTTLRIIAGFEEASSGEVLFDGMDISKIPAYKREINTVFQKYALFPHMNVFDNVAFGLNIKKMDKAVIKTKVERMLAMVGLANYGSKDVTLLSGGQQQRVLLARAICQEPEIILLDEPTSFLDVRHKLDLLSILTRMARKKDITVIMSLHEIDLAEKVADRILTVKGNQQYGYGAPGEIFEENAIRKLYDIEDGYFDPLFGSIELKKPTGDVPEVFVLAGGGAGIPVYRQLQRENIPFATGVLYTNDLDYRLARLLAAQTITAEPFGPIPADTYAQAEKVMRKCKKVILAGEAARSPNAPLTALAEQLGLLKTGNEQSQTKSTAHT